MTTTTILPTALLLALASTGRADAGRHDDAQEEDSEREEAPKADKRERRWSVAVGPSVWAASIDSTLTLGPLQLHRSVPFAQIVQYLDGGMSGALEARYDHVTATGNFQYGTLAASTEEGGSLDAKGSLTQILAEAALGYEVLGGGDAPLTLELRAGLRYTQLDIEAMGTLGVAGTTISAAGGLHRGGTDYLFGARARLRVHRRVAFVATGDTRIAGESYATWSLAGDLHVRATSWLTLSAGWRVLETQANPTTMRRNGPQLAALFGF